MDRNKIKGEEWYNINDLRMRDLRCCRDVVLAELVVNR